MFNFTHLWKRVSVMVLSIWVVSTMATFAQSDNKRTPGKVVVANVDGKAEAVEPERRTPKLLKRNDIISEKSTVNVAKASAATLVFANGSTINLLENSSLVITDFLQNPFSMPITTAILTEEPSTSVTELNLAKGEVVCNVKKLRRNEGSSFTVNTPVGAAGVRGTIFAVSFVEDAEGNGKWVYTLSVTEGEVALTDTNGKVRLVAAGKEVVITVRVAEDPDTGKITVIEVLGFEIRDISDDRQNFINETAGKWADAALMFFVDIMEVDPQDAFNQINDAPPVVHGPPSTTLVDP